ncbi:MFS transporter [Peribacillus cavernae]|uniref:MFS transporter n=1 Tax=Peribacillus cavernae TaxID=1674310 RepID=A0A3S0TTV3_9BACI|nr:MFS transporter [Peribacillus cavernae]MDQ0219267.1 sugar phosphate permease [Peribacillus cavernae]RUQ27836.1 MFS transporter [Peribacillus cavernae]
MKDIKVNSNYRSKILLLMFFGAAINYMDRSNIGIAAPLIAEHFQFNDAQMGIILSSVLWTYMIVQIPMGILIDKFGSRIMVFVGVLVWSVTTGLTGIATGFTSLLLYRMAMGLGEAPTFPAFSRAASQWFPTNERGKANASFISAVMFGSAFTPPLVTFFMIRFGWASAFFVTGLISIIWAFLWWKYFRNRPVESSYVSQKELSVIGDTDEKYSPANIRMYALLKYRNVWALMIGLFAINYVLYIFVTWLPTFLVNAKNLSLSKTGFIAMIPYVFAFILVWVFGLMSDRLVRKGWSSIKSCRTLAVIGMTISLSILLAVQVESIFWVILFLSLSLGGVMAANGVIWALPGAISKSNYVGRIGALQNFAGNIGGALAPLITGFIVQSTGSFTVPLSIGGGLALIAILSYLFLMKEQPTLIGDHNLSNDTSKYIDANHSI